MTRRQKQREYLLKELADLSANDLLTASRQVCKAIRQQAKDKNIDVDVEEVFIGASYALMKCLYLYSDKADKDNAKTLLHIIQDRQDDVFLRRFLLLEIWSQKSIEKFWSQESIRKMGIAFFRDRPNELRSILHAIYLDEKDDQFVRAAAISSSQSIWCDVYYKLIRSDNEINKTKIPKNTSLEEVRKQNIALTPETRKALADMDKEAMSFIENVDAIYHNVNNSKELRQEAKQCINDLITNGIPFNQTDKLRAMSEKLIPPDETPKSEKKLREINEKIKLIDETYRTTIKKNDDIGEGGVYSIETMRALSAINDQFTALIHEVELVINDKTTPEEIKPRAEHLLIKLRALIKELIPSELKHKNAQP